MSLTISNHCNQITNEPTMDVATSLTEGASYQNLRIRAEIFMAGETSKIATLEQTKGLDSWNFTRLLNNYLGRCDIAVGGSDRLISPNAGSELLTAWNSYGPTTAFTSSGREITALTGNGAGSTGAYSNSLGAQSAGDLLVIGIENAYTNSGSDTAVFDISTAPGAFDNDNPYNTPAANKIFFHLAIEAIANGYLVIGHPDGDIDVTLKATAHQISDFRNNPSAYFRIKFTEVYENASGVTTTGATAVSGTVLFMPVTIPAGDDFDTDYMLAGTSDKFLNKAVRNGMKHISGVGGEMRLLFVSDETYILPYDSQAGEGSAEKNCGWGMLIINDDTITTLTSDIYFAVYYSRGAGTARISENLTVLIDNKCYDDMAILTFFGDLGEEVFNFTGGTDKGYRVTKETMLNSYGIEQTLSALRKTEMDIYTGWVSDDLLPLFLEALSTTYQVYMIDENETSGYKEVSVTDKNLQVKARNSLKQHKLGIEYHE